MQNFIYCMICILGLTATAQAQFDQYSIGSLGGELVAIDSSISLVQSIGELGGAKAEISLFTPGFPQCWGEDCGTCSPTSSSQQLIDNNISIFPNPTSGFLSIQMGETSTQQYQILNTTGKLVQNGACSNDTILDLNPLPSGMYFIVFTDWQHRILFASKIIKQ